MSKRTIVLIQTSNGFIFVDFEASDELWREIGLPECQVQSFDEKKFDSDLPTPEIDLSPQINQLRKDIEALTGQISAKESEESPVKEEIEERK